jgi:hypothetical protein
MDCWVENAAVFLSQPLFGASAVNKISSLIYPPFYRFAERDDHPKDHMGFPPVQTRRKTTKKRKDQNKFVVFFGRKGSPARRTLLPSR